MRFFGALFWGAAASFVCSSAFAANTGFTPINDLGGGLYLSQYQGGLYPAGSNTMPAAQAAAGLSHAAAITPRDVNGLPSPTGKFVLLSIGLSNTTQEWCSTGGGLPAASWTFMGQAAVSSSVNHTTLTIANGALGGKSAAFWDSSTDPDYDRVRDTVLTPQSLSENQVEAAWLKVANPNPTVSLPNANADANVLETQMGNIVRAMKTRYPNLQEVFVSSRIFAGNATSTLNPEPYAYESGFSVKHLIEAQINQMNGGGIDPLAGDLNYGSTGPAPWLAWGPYLWADGTNARSDGLTWVASDFESDGTHPSTSGETKVANQLMSFFLTSPQTQTWFLAPEPGSAAACLLCGLAVLRRRRRA